MRIVKGECTGMLISKDLMVLMICETEVDRWVAGTNPIQVFTNKTYDNRMILAGYPYDW